MNIGVFATRLAGTDGVSLEAAKVARVLERRGHRVVNCAGELAADLDGTVVPGMHFEDPAARDHVRRAFDAAGADPTLEREIDTHASELEVPIARFVEEHSIDFAIVQNAFSIPMHLSLAQALRSVLTGHDVPTLGHHHDFPWERERFSRTVVPEFVDAHFPPIAPSIEHAVINSIARRELEARTGAVATIIPNVIDFATPPPGIDDFNADFRAAIGISDDDVMILQPTRVIPRKHIELAIELVARLDDPAAKLVITHRAGDEGTEYLGQLRRLADDLGVSLLHVADVIDAERGRRADGSKVYSLWDAYPHADFVTYPSAIEGFGNALVEAVYFRRPVLVNRYPVYRADIAPLGFRFVECEDRITDDTVADVRSLLISPEERRIATEHNFRLGAEHFSFEALDTILSRLVPG